jgi:hypothetical protein
LFLSMRCGNMNKIQAKSPHLNGRVGLHRRALNDTDRGFHGVLNEYWGRRPGHWGYSTTEGHTATTNGGLTPLDTRRRSVHLGFAVKVHILRHLGCRSGGRLPSIHIVHAGGHRLRQLTADREGRGETRNEVVAARTCGAREGEGTTEAFANRNCHAVDDHRGEDKEVDHWTDHTDVSVRCKVSAHSRRCWR